MTRKIAYDILWDVLKEGTFLNISLKNRLKPNMSVQDKRFVTALATTTLENLNRIDYVVSLFISKSIPFKAKMAVRLGVCQLMFFESVPSSAAVNESVKLIKQIGKKQQAGFVNATLRNIAENLGGINYPSRSSDAAEFLSVMYSYPKWLCEKYIKDYGLDFTEDMLAYKKTDAKTCVRVNTLKTTFGEIKKTLPIERGKYIPCAGYLNSVSSIEKMDEFVSGKLAVQSEASMLCVVSADIGKSDSVLDLCAAPGGKTAFAATFNPEGKITACDIYDHRLNMMGENLKRLGVQNAEIQKSDCMQHNPEWESGFDRVLLDAPCSALGLLYRKPDIKYKKTDEDLKSLCKMQSQMLKVASGYVKPGGILLYSTCTINKDENEKQVLEFIRENKGFELLPLINILPEQLVCRVKDNMLQLFAHIDGIDGFFMAAIKRLS